MCLLAAAGVGRGRRARRRRPGPLRSGRRALGTREALRRLDADPSVRRIVVISKPPAPEVATWLDDHVATLSTPVDLALLGRARPDLTTVAESLLTSLGCPVPDWPVWGAVDGQQEPSSGYLRGLFVGRHPL